MNKIISDSLIVFLIPFLLVAAGGCAEKQYTSPQETHVEKTGEIGEIEKAKEDEEGAGKEKEETLIELLYEPIPGILNPWDRWYAEGNIQYIRAPTEKELITDYYGNVYNIEIIEISRIEACELAYSCDETFLYIIKVEEGDAETMKELGWKEAEETGLF